MLQNMWAPSRDRNRGCAADSTSNTPVFIISLGKVAHADIRIIPLLGSETDLTRETTLPSDAFYLKLHGQPEASREVGVGLDYGTSNSAAAVFDGRQVHIVFVGLQPRR
jgi:hypothetical protein